MRRHYRNDSPPDDPVAGCDLCGKDCDDCTCPECPDCGAHGCIQHLDSRELLERFYAAKDEIDRRGGERKIRHDVEGDCDRTYAAMADMDYQDVPCEFCFANGIKEAQPKGTPA